MDEKTDNVVHLNRFREPKVDQNEYADRLGRIRLSIEKINRFMRELREMSAQEPPENWPEEAPR